MTKRVQRSPDADKSQAAEPGKDIGVWGYALIAVSLSVIIWLPQYSVPWMLVVAIIAEFNEGEGDAEVDDWTSSLALTGYSFLMFAAAYVLWRWLETDPGSLASYLYPDEDSAMPNRLVLLAWLMLFMGSIRFLRAAHSILRNRS